MIDILYATAIMLAAQIAPDDAPRHGRGAGMSANPYVRTQADRDAAADRGMKLLDKRQNNLHPRAQLQALRRKAAIAIGKADRMYEHAHLYDDPAAQRTLARAQSQRAIDCTEAMVRLNAEHGLGYPVPR